MPAEYNKAPVRKQAEEDGSDEDFLLDDEKDPSIGYSWGYEERVEEDSKKKDMLKDIHKRLEEDSWWSRFVNLHNSYINLHNKEKPNLCIMDEASMHVYLKESEKRPFEDNPFKGTLIAVTRLGCSEVRFYYKIDVWTKLDQPVETVGYVNSALLNPPPREEDSL